MRETNTLARLHVLTQEKILDESLWAKAVDAYEMQMQLRIIHQLNQIEADIQPDNYIAPDELSELEKRMLRDAFEVIDRLHGVLKTMFPTPDHAFLSQAPQKDTFSGTSAPCSTQKQKAIC